MDSFVVHQRLQFKQYTIYIRGVFLPTAGPSMAGISFPAMMNLIAANSALPSVWTAAQRRPRLFNISTPERKMSETRIDDSGAPANLTMPSPAGGLGCIIGGA